MSDPTTSPQQITDVVLVHGAFADGSGWRGVYDDLVGRGYRVTIVQNPLTSFEDDVAATRRVLDRLEGPAVLVGHSWGGTVITEAGTHPNVAALVYLSALAPASGENTSQQYEGFAGTPDFVIDVGEDGFGFLHPETFQIGFAADAPADVAAFLRDTQVPINMSAFATPVTTAAWESRPSWAIIATEDRAFDPAMLQHMARRSGATTIEIPGSHASYVTHPDLVAAVVDEAARTVSAAAAA